MTKEEALDILHHNWTRVDNPNYDESELDEAINMAIEALSNNITESPNGAIKPSNDVINRADAIKAFENKIVIDGNDDVCKFGAYIQGVMDKIKALPSADAEPKWKCTANFVAEQLEKLEDMSVSEKLKLIQDLLGVEVKEENINYKHATLVDIKEPLKVEVVRCKDCRWWQDDYMGTWCGRLSGVRSTNADDYCSWGERND